jgi:hypothetical protein
MSTHPSQRITWDKCGQSIKLTTHLHFEPKLRLHLALISHILKKFVVIIINAMAAESEGPTPHIPKVAIGQNNESVSSPFHPHNLSP